MAVSVVGVAGVDGSAASPGSGSEMKLGVPASGAGSVAGAVGLVPRSSASIFTTTFTRLEIASPSSSSWTSGSSTGFTRVSGANIIWTRRHWPSAQVGVPADVTVASTTSTCVSRAILEELMAAALRSSEATSVGASLRLSATVRVPVVAAASATAICTRSSGWPLLESWALAKVLVTEPSLTLRFVGCGIVAAGCVGPASAAGEAAVAAGVSVVAAGVGAVVGLVSGTSSVFGARFVVARSVVAFWRGAVVAAGASQPSARRRRAG